jgi:hypothetical protein
MCSSSAAAARAVLRVAAFLRAGPVPGTPSQPRSFHSLAAQAPIRGNETWCIGVEIVASLCVLAKMTALMRWAKLRRRGVSEMLLVELYRSGHTL